VWNHKINGIKNKVKCVSRPPWRAWFEASSPPLYLFLKGYRLLIGHRREVKGMGIAFRGFLSGKVFCLDHYRFNSCFDLFVLGSTLRLYFCSGQERGAPSSAVSFQERPKQTSGHVRKVKVEFWSLYFWNSRFRFL